MPSNSSEKAIPGIRLKKLVIDNFKAIDHLELDFPEPRMADEPDVMVIGSKNGVGKTSILEACSLLLVNSIYMGLFDKDNNIKEDFFNNFFAMGTSHPSMQDGFPVNLSDYCVRSGQAMSDLHGFYTFGDKNLKRSFSLKNNISSDGIKFYSNFTNKPDSFPPDIDKKSVGGIKENWIRTLEILFGFLPEKLIVPRFLYFNSYRKIKEGPVKISTDKEPEDFFKNEIVRTYMNKSGIIEGAQVAEADNVFNVCNELIEKYSSHKLSLLRHVQENEVDIRISHSKIEPTISFDGLSSGQKEIISTLFLIWKHTKDNPGIVLIDEPELHLNADWHSELIYQLFNLVPQNQYIIATHSEDVFASVEKDRRIIISAD